MKEPALDDFERNVDFVREGDGFLFSCKKGLWSVESSSYFQAEKEAMRYFRQYWEDGEYEDATN